LHGLALIGVRAVLGVDSPFNVQRSLHVPNLTRDEVVELFRQYQAESGQTVEPEVVQQVFDVTRGQPGLVSWFGELLTEKYNPGPGNPIMPADFELVYARACQVEWNNTILNLVKKARGPYQSQVVSLFTNPNVPFAMDRDWCSYLYMNGVIDAAPAPDDPLGARLVCRFSSPFVQRRLFAALTDDMFGDRGPILALEVGDLLADVFTPEGLSVPPLLARYRAYLKRLEARGIDPWIGQPRRADLHLTEAVGHFHLYAWLRDAVGRRKGGSGAPDQGRARRPRRGEEFRRHVRAGRGPRAGRRLREEARARDGDAGGVRADGGRGRARGGVARGGDRRREGGRRRHRLGVTRRHGWLWPLLASPPQRKPPPRRSGARGGRGDDLRFRLTTTFLASEQAVGIRRRLCEPILLRRERAASLASWQARSPS
jgi:hypothetical protein